MDDQQTYIRGKLAEAAAKRGGIAELARATETDQRTLRAILNATHATNIKTLSTLEKYFKRADKRAQKEVA
jgi:hypothetical protein